MFTLLIEGGRGGVTVPCVLTSSGCVDSDGKGRVEGSPRTSQKGRNGERIFTPVARIAIRCGETAAMLGWRKIGLCFCIIRVVPTPGYYVEISASLSRSHMWVLPFSPYLTVFEQES